MVGNTLFMAIMPRIGIPLMRVKLRTGGVGNVLIHAYSDHDLHSPARLNPSFPKGALQGALRIYRNLQCAFKGAWQGALRKTRIKLCRGCTVDGLN